MERIIKILMERDGETREDAIDIIKSVKEELEFAIEENDMMLVEDIMYGDLGLEMDYIFDIVGIF